MAATQQAIQAVSPNGKSEFGRLFSTMSAEQQHRAFEYLLKSGALPQHIKTPHLLNLAYRLLEPLGLDLVVNLRNTWYNPTSRTMDLCNDAPLAACQRRRGEYVGTVEYHVNSKGERRTQHNFIGFRVEGAVCIAKRQGKEDCVGLFTMEQARQAALLGKDNWKKYPEAMLTKRARAIALRLQWADVLQGVGIFEADDFVAPKATLGSGRAVVEAMLGKQSQLSSQEDAQDPPADAPQSPEPAAAQTSEPEATSEDEVDIGELFGPDEMEREPGAE